VGGRMGLIINKNIEILLGNECSLSDGEQQDANNQHLLLRLSIILLYENAIFGERIPNLGDVKSIDKIVNTKIENDENMEVGLMEQVLDNFIILILSLSEIIFVIYCISRS
jgi:hypothetical protein